MTWNSTVSTVATTVSSYKTMQDHTKFKGFYETLKFAKECNFE